MKKKLVIIGCISVVLLTILGAISATYAVIIDATDDEEIKSSITLKSLLTRDDESYNNYYYNARDELNLTSEEAEILLNSEPLNEALQKVLQNVVAYKINNKEKYSNEKLYKIIKAAVDEETNISDDLKARILDKTYKYINDISQFLYDISVNVLPSGL